MKQVPFFAKGSSTTVLGYGTPCLMGLSTTAERLAMLDYAFDTGIRHFDTAPYYGYGEAERLLGSFLKNRRRDEITITTKYGIKPPALVKARWVNLLARQIFRFLPTLRKAASRQARALTQKSIFTATEARTSLDQSLTALKTDYVDLFLLHEPRYEDAISEELHAYLDHEVRRGRIRAYGCGGDFSVIEKIVNARQPTAAWLQFEDNAVSRHIECVKRPGVNCITFGSFRNPLNVLARWLESPPSRYGEWERQLGVDCRQPSNLASLLQATSHARNLDGIVLFSTRQKDRISAAVKIASGQAFSPEQLRKFDELTQAMRPLL